MQSNKEDPAQLTINIYIFFKKKKKRKEKPGDADPTQGKEKVLSPSSGTDAMVLEVTGRVREGKTDQMTKIIPLIQNFCLDSDLSQTVCYLSFKKKDFCHSLVFQGHP